MTFEDFCSQNNIYISFVELPLSNRGLCIYLDGNFEILVNRRFSSSQQKHTIIHELIHIIEDHFFDDNSCPVDHEKEVQKLIKNMHQFEFLEVDL